MSEIETMNEEGTSARLRQVVTRVLQLPKSTDLSELERNQITQWDSLGHAELVLALQREFSIRFTVPEILAMESFALIESTLQKKLHDN